MQNLLNFDIEPNGVLSTAVLAAGFSSFESFAKYVRSLPYGRIEPSNDGLAVLREKRGTCSSKHQLLALLAHECGHTEISLTIGIYETVDVLFNVVKVGGVTRSLVHMF